MPPKVLSVQIQPDRSPGLDCRALLASLRALCADASISEGDEDGRYINVNFRVADIVGLWSAINALLVADSRFAKSAIVVCQGNQGWDDYLLLHHFDSSLTLDTLSN